MTIDFLLTEEQRLLRDTVRSFAEAQVGPLAAEIDRTGDFPRRLYGAMAEMGLYGLMVPDELGGAGGDTVMQGLVQEELARFSGTIANLQVSAHESALTLSEHAPPTVAKHYMAKVMSGEMVPSFALTEPTAGSDAAGIRTTAQLVGDKFVVSGAKQFVTFGAVADFCIVLAVTDPASEKDRVSAILIDLDAPGVTIGKQEDLVGVRGTATAPITFDDVVVPAGNLIGQLGKGLRLGLSQIDKGRIATAGMAVGIAQGALEAAMSYALQRQQFGRPIFEFQAVQFKLAQMAMRIDAARLLYVSAAKLRDQGGSSARASSQAKLFGSETAAWVTDEALQLFGGYGYVRDNPIERYWRDAKITQIYEGTSNIQHLIIARQLFKEAKENAK
ncbi:acyl-CoA dehydrogenase family protein [Mesorhizobium sp.]|uniref:acyl-CoA dehydrogenase family protein n=1 Tax=Mesorhizobium sp. TaxID=1871066 RepID=UPI0025D2B6D3|nr:acyl-CoA dehydrogenase family protein [Mesorhizobium sp.]